MKKYNSKIYLLKVDTNDKRLYKIGFTRGSIEQRIKSLQTGCPFEIKLVDFYESDYGQTLEKSLQNRFNYKKTFGEWFELDLVEEFKFIEMCENLEKINESLEKNNYD